MSTTHNPYVHGYDSIEHQRLLDQANTLSSLIHADTGYPAGATVLEAGCGVGAQTVILAAKSPGAHITSMDISPVSLAAAEKRVREAGFDAVRFVQGDIFNPPFAPQSFDHLFLCFVLEHLRDPVAALTSLKRLLKPGGTVTVIEGDHGSAYYHPRSEAAQRTIDCLIEIQARIGGDSLIGRRLFPLLQEAGFHGVSVSPRMVYVDGSRPALIEGFTRQTFTAMIEGVKEAALQQKLISPEAWEQGIRDLYRTAAPDGTFCYCFFRASGKL